MYRPFVWALRRVSVYFVLFCARLLSFCTFHSWYCTDYCFYPGVYSRPDFFHHICHRTRVLEANTVVPGRTATGRNKKYLTRTGPSRAQQWKKGDGQKAFSLFFCGKKKACACLKSKCMVLKSANKRLKHAMPPKSAATFVFNEQFTQNKKKHKVLSFGGPCPCSYLIC